MDGLARGIRVQVFFGEAEQVGRTARYQAILEYLRREGAAGATVVRGIAGFGANSRIHTAAILRLSLDLPLVVTWIDAPGRVERLLPGLRELAGSGIVTVEEVWIAAYGGRRLEQLRFDLPVEDAMTRPVVSASESDTVRAAAEALVGREFRALPVVDDAGRLVGVVSNTDLIERGGLGARIELLSAMEPDAREVFLDRIPADRLVGDVMTRDVVSVGTRDTVAAATRVMSERGLKRLPVVDAAGLLVGILSRADVLRAVGETFPRDSGAVGTHPGAQTVGEVMRTDVPTVAASADLAALLDAVVSTRLNRAVVVDAERRVLGVVRDADVLRSVDPAARGGLVDALMRTAGRPPGAGVTAGEIVERAAITATPDTSLAEAARLMTAHGRKILPIVDAEGRLVGVVDRADLLHASRGALEELVGAAPVDDEE